MNALQGWDRQQTTGPRTRDLRKPFVQPTFSKFVAVPNSAGSARVRRETGSVSNALVQTSCATPSDPGEISSLAASFSDGERQSRGEAYCACRTAWPFLKKIFGDPSRVEVASQLGS